MPKKPAGRYPVSLVVPNGAFGETVTASVSPISSIPPTPRYTFVKFTCQSATGGQVGWAEVDVTTGFASLTFGPTPSWSSGAAVGNAYVVTYDPTTGAEKQISDGVAFNVAA